MDLHLQGVHVTFLNPEGKSFVVLSIDQFAVTSGTQLCLVGSSGSGKTTLLHVLAGIVTPTRGNITYGTTDITKLSESARDRFRALHIGYVFQNFNLLQSLSALENVALAGTLAGLKRNEARARAQKLLERVGLSHRLTSQPATLSAGEQQRVAMARAVINKPGMILADEPTANLDQERGAQVLSLLQEICTENQSTLLLVTHQPHTRQYFSNVVALDEISTPSPA